MIRKILKTIGVFTILAFIGDLYDRYTELEKRAEKLEKQSESTSGK